ncbi:MAG: OmpH family outer membrane protein [Chitinophagaceae bacterium]|nr:OmpH family outer membrane protein [Chitinophagaceae bacterium]
MKRNYRFFTLLILPILFSIIIFSCDNASKNTTSKKSKSGKTVKSTDQVISTSSRIAYVDIDTLEANYDYFVKKKAEFENRQKKIDAELESLANSIQQEYINFQKKAQSGSVSEEEGLRKQKELMKKQENLELKKQNLGVSFLKAQEAFNKEIKDKLYEVIEEYNSDNKYDFVLSYQKDGAMLYANPELDITKEILKSINNK